MALVAKIKDGLFSIPVLGPGMRASWRSLLGRPLELVEPETLTALQRSATAREVTDTPDSAPIPLKPGEKVRVAFFFQASHIWPSWKSLWQACASDGRIDAHMVLMPCHDGDETRTYLQARDFLLDQDIPFFYSECYDIESFRPHVAFVQFPYDFMRPTEFRSPALRAKGVRVAYVPYGLEIGGGARTIQCQYDLDVHNSAWRIFARSDRHRRMFSRYCAAGSRHVVVTGHPKLDNMAELSTGAPDDKLVAFAAGRRTVLWTPHFTVGALPLWSTYPLMGEEILEAIRQRPDLAVIFRPHPLFLPKMRSEGLLTADGERELRDRLAAIPNLFFDERPHYLSAFAVADALMADAGSFLLEFLPTGKPILYLSNPCGPGLSEEGEVVADYYQATVAAEAIAFLDMVRAGDDPKHDQRLSRIPEFFHALDGQAGMRIRDHLMAVLAAGADGSPRHRKGSTDSQDSRLFWENSTNSFLGSSEYYDLQEKIMRSDILPHMGRPRRGLDIGCGNGRYTFLLGERCEKLEGYDISASLITEAVATAREKGVANVQFAANDVISFFPHGVFDFISCMGVTSCIIDERDFVLLRDNLIASLLPGGLLLLKDTLSLGQGKELVRHPNGYVAAYRNAGTYLQAFCNKGLVVERQATLMHSEQHRRQNLLILLRKPL